MLDSVLLAIVFVETTKRVARDEIHVLVLNTRAKWQQQNQQNSPKNRSKRDD